LYYLEIQLFRENFFDGLEFDIKSIIDKIS
jgi:hypothetical protein